MYTLQADIITEMLYPGHLTCKKVGPGNKGDIDAESNTLVSWEYYQHNYITLDFSRFKPSLPTLHLLCELLLQH